MRAFHYSWSAFFIAFFIWFAISPLLSEIRDDLRLTKGEVWTSSIVGVGGTIFVRFLVGPLCDTVGPRVLFTIMLIAAAIPTACTGLVNSATGLAILRLFIGIAGGTFVTCQYWTSRMFTKEVVGTANALVGGWGNLGAGVTQLIMGSALYPLFKVLCNDDSELAWRTVCIVPAVVAMIWAICLYYFSDDAPKGNYSELKKHGVMLEIDPVESFRIGSLNWNTWVLFIQYACCFGVELTMNNAAALYFKDEFGQSTEAAAAIASIFGWMNLFARGLGGFISDVSNTGHGMRGRLWTHTIFLFCEGALVLFFANSSSLGTAIIIMVFFSLFVQAAEGSSYAIVPYVDPPNMGSISGIVGAGGNVGAVAFGLGFRQLSYQEAFLIMGCSILVSSALSVFIHIKGYSGMLWGEEQLVDKETGSLIVPEVTEEWDDPEKEKARRSDKKGFKRVPNRDEMSEDE
mmetsp:Transcript_11592/g.25908  ORF Transcript_11592/g.25908 Transcript_11592/m.25908 type:complete len:459 (+) Transcript_11592:272-1648(+)